VRQHRCKWDHVAQQNTIYFQAFIEIKPGAGQEFIFFIDFL
jgi:hypothetical protein